MKKETTIAVGAILGAVAVAIGAFGAHGLKSFLEQAGRTETFELAIRYHFYHALTLVATGLAMQNYHSKTLGYSAWLFVGGIILFSGSLLALCFTGLGMLGAVTPIGGICFIAGWVCLAIGVYKK
jgi:uncharacterized membrane protein YgdD (TMEM256/DUF423 family)